MKTGVEICEFCNGSGTYWVGVVATCPYCYGTGKVKKDAKDERGEPNAN